MTRFRKGRKEGGEGRDSTSASFEGKCFGDFARGGSRALSVGKSAASPLKGPAWYCSCENGSNQNRHPFPLKLERT